MLHPVGPLPTAVYWRRRLLVLLGTLGVLTGGGWLGVAAVTGGAAPGTAVAAPTTGTPAPTPALEQVVPSLAAVQVPPVTPTSSASAAPGTVVPGTSAVPVTSAAPPPPAPVSGGPCSDDMIAVEVRADPPSAPVGSKPTFDLVVTDVSPVPCVRALDKGLREIVLADAAGNRVWGSNDCFPEASSDPRTLQPGEPVVLPVLWSGLGSTPGCTGNRVPPPAGAYLLRGRLDTKTSADAPFTLT